MPEAVAIVYSPIESAIFRAFRVKDDRVGEIKSCKKSGFHEHNDANNFPAFEVCSHIKYIKGAESGVRVKTIDLR